MAKETATKLPAGKELSLPYKSVWIFGNNYRLSRDIVYTDSPGEVRKRLAEISESGAQFPSSSYLSKPENAAYEELLVNVQSKICITYRSNFFPIKPTELTADSGWGCMLRSAQMLLAEGLIRYYLGRHWRKPQNAQVYIQIVSWFLDYPDKTTFPFSIHAIAQRGVFYDTPIGRWFDPSTAGAVLGDLIHQFSRGDLLVYSSKDTTIYLDDISSLFTKTRPLSNVPPTLPKKNLCSLVAESSVLDVQSCPSWPQLECPALFILVPLRLGVEKINAIYYPALKACFTMPQCIGITGGRPNSAYYFIGFEGNYLLYLDPHSTKAVVPKKNLEDYQMEDFVSYHCETPKKMAITDADPSLLVAFLCVSFTDVEDLVQRLKKVEQVAKPIIHVAKTAPTYSEKEINSIDWSFD